MSDDPLPTDTQRIRLHDMVAMAFVEIRLLGWGGRAEQAADLADAFHNNPREIYGWVGWSIEITRGMLQTYQDKYHDEEYSGRTNYVVLFNAIFQTGGEQDVHSNACPVASSICHDHSTLNPEFGARPRSGLG